MANKLNKKEEKEKSFGSEKMDKEENETVINCHSLKMIAQDGKLRETKNGE